MYTIVIDESGDTGVRNVKPDPSFGPSQYFTMCATLFDEQNRQQIEDRLSALPFLKGKALHMSKIGHFEKIKACREISELPVGMLGIISNKLSLGSYLPQARKTNTHFYNKVLHYLLERVGATLACLDIGKEDARIRLEAREQQYSSLMAYLARIQRNPLNRRASYLRHIDRFSITAVSKSDESCMQISDVGAHALFCAVRKDARSFGITEPCYLQELSTKFLAHTSGKIVPYGIKPVHSLDDLEIDDQTRVLFKDFKNPISSHWRLQE